MMMMMMMMMTNFDLKGAVCD